MKKYLVFGKNILLNDDIANEYSEYGKRLSDDYEIDNASLESILRFSDEHVLSDDCLYAMSTEEAQGRIDNEINKTLEEYHWLKQNPREITTEIGIKKVWVYNILGYDIMIDDLMISRFREAEGLDKINLPVTPDYLKIMIGPNMKFADQETLQEYIVSCMKNHILSHQKLLAANEAAGNRLSYIRD